MNYKITGIKHKDLVNYQYEVLGMKCNPHFYQRQCSVTKKLLTLFEYEDILLIMKMYNEVGKPKNYKSIYFFMVDTQNKIDQAKSYFKTKEELNKVENVTLNNIKKKNNFVPSIKF